VPPARWIEQQSVSLREATIEPSRTGKIAMKKGTSSGWGKKKTRKQGEREGDQLHY